MSDADNDKQIVVSENIATHLPPAQRPVIVFNALTDDQFNKALQLFAPPPRTKPNLWARKEYTKDLIKCAAFCEAVPSMRPDGRVFANNTVTNNFDNCMIQKFRDGDEKFGFAIQEWFTDTLTRNGKNPIPDALKNWNPDKPPYDLQPKWDSGVDWCAKLTKVDLKYEGFLELLSNCIDLDELLQAEINKRKHGANSTFGVHPSTRMPDPINQQADFEQFTPSGLLGQGQGLFGGRN